MSPRADRGLCFGTASGSWKEEELGERGYRAQHLGELRRNLEGQRGRRGLLARTPSALCSSGFLPETFQGSLPWLPSSTLGLGKAERARKRVP